MAVDGFNNNTNRIKGTGRNQILVIPNSTLQVYGLIRNALKNDGGVEEWHYTPLEVTNYLRGAKENWALENMYYNGIELGFNK